MPNEKLVERIQESLLLHLNATLGSEKDCRDAAYHMANVLMTASEVLQQNQFEIDRLNQHINSLTTQLASVIRLGIA
jgi:hypothetical protein